MRIARGLQHVPGVERQGEIRLFSLKRGERDKTSEGSCKGAGENLVSWPISHGRKQKA